MESIYQIGSKNFLIKWLNLIFILLFNLKKEKNHMSIGFKENNL